MDAEQFPQPLLTGSFFILMKILISILFHPPSFAVDVMLMSVCQSNDCSFSGYLALNENGQLSPDYIRLPSTHQSSSSSSSPCPFKDLWVVRLEVGEANEISPVGKYLRYGRRVIRSGAKRNEVSSEPSSTRPEPNQRPSTECTCEVQWTSRAS